MVMPMYDKSDFRSVLLRVSLAARLVELLTLSKLRGATCEAGPDNDTPRYRSITYDN